MKDLGTRIRENRERCGLSQLEFSELIDVSHQAVSKWENGTAIPELLKLVRMSDIFGISLDSLVTGIQSESSGKDLKEVSSECSKTTKKKENSIGKIVMGVFFLTVGTLLSLFFVFSAPIFGLLLFLPFALCSFFCLKQLRYAWLWCGECWFVFFTAYLCYGTGISYESIFDPLIYNLEYSNEWYPISAWAQLLLLIFFVFMTVYAFRGSEFNYSKRIHITVAMIGSVAATLHALYNRIFSRLCLYLICDDNIAEYVNFLSENEHILLITELGTKLVLTAVFTVCLIPTVYFIKKIIKQDRTKRSASNS